jgi:hypothetical protein
MTTDTERVEQKPATEAAMVAELAARFPGCFVIEGRDRRPLKRAVATNIGPVELADVAIPIIAVGRRCGPR